MGRDVHESEGFRSRRRGDAAGVLLRTDGRGRYSYRTIRPGSYPGTRVPQHIHYEATADGRGTRVFEIVFEDDPFLNAQVRAEAARPGSFYALRSVKKGPDGVGRVTQDIVLPDA